jgi:chromate transporter
VPSEPGSLREIAAVMLKVGTLGFGGPAVHVAMMREEVVGRRAWLGDGEFLELFGAVSILPGPSSTQLAIALCRRRGGWRGLVVGGLCFIAPAMTIVLLLARAYVRYGATPTGKDVLYGIAPVVAAIVLVALWQLARGAFKRPWFVVVALLAAASYLARVDVLLPLVGGGLVVAVVENARRPVGGTAVVLPFLPLLPVFASSRPRPGTIDVFAEFAKLGVVVFGSGYVLLAFLRADLVTGLHWLTERQVLDAVAAGQVTPGPVFTTATFVGYLVGGVPLALAATVGIFLPSFVMVLAIEPVVVRIRRTPWLRSALDGVVVAALGLMAGVALDLLRNAVSDVATAVIGVVALAVLLRWRPNATWLIAAGALVGLLRAVT